MFRKNILILIDKKNNTEEFNSFLKEIFRDEKINLLVFNKGEFYLDDEKKVEVDSFLTVSDFIFNFLEDISDFEKIQKKIELLKIKYFGNKLSIQKIFSEKINFKKIIEKSEFKTPVFEKINGRSALEIFNNFPQPLRIFSKKNDYFSGRLDNLNDIQETLENNITDGYVEEFIVGEEIFSFVFKLGENNFHVLSLIKDENSLKKIDLDLNNKITETILDFLKLAEINNFALFNLVNSKNRGLYFLNIWVKNNIIFEKKEILENILNKDEYSLEKFLKSCLNKD